MEEITHRLVVVFGVIIAGIMAVSTPCVAQDFNARTNANSPNGSVPHDARAYSPDGQYYVKEVSPYNEGNIAVFEIKGGKEIQRWDLLPNNNDLKGLAWAPDSKRIAVMYHGGVTAGIQVIELGKEGVVATADFEGYPHFITWDKNGTDLILRDSETRETQRVKVK